MKKIAKLSLTFLVAGIVSACGSSGGSGDSSSSAADTTETTNNGSNLNTGTTLPITMPNSIGVAVRINDGQKFDLAKASIYKTLLEVDGKKLPLRFDGLPPEHNAIGIYGVTGGVLSGNDFSNVKFGHMEGYTFIQGNVTPRTEMPTSGLVTYAVDSIFIDNSLGEDIRTSISQGYLNVDFANKTVNGNIHRGENITITDAKINGNTFNGSAVYMGNSAELKGYFYGSNADEIGGAYGSSTFSGAFGGKKQ